MRGAVDRHHGLARTGGPKNNQMTAGGQIDNIALMALRRWQAHDLLPVDHRRLGEPDTAPPRGNELYQRRTRMKCAEPPGFAARAASSDRSCLS